MVPVLAFLGQAILLISKIVTGDVLAVLKLVLGGVIGLVLIGVGYQLRIGAEGPLYTTPEADATV
jgi:hypothetical protein